MTVIGLRTAGALETRVRALFSPGSPPSPGPGSIGVEVELLAVDVGSWPPRPVSPPAVERALDHDPGLRDAAGISFEPGGQLELSPAPAPSAAACLARLDVLLARVRRCGEAAGISFLPGAVFPWPGADRIGLQVDTQRYRALQAHFDSIGPAGRRMMRQTAALQVCVDPGDADRWQLLNRAGPALTAAFAASPLLDGRPTGRRGSRTALWLDADPSRTGFDGAHLGGDPAAGYTVMALDARAVLLPRDGCPPPPCRPLRRLLDAGADRPDEPDIEHHLTTLFPPVRPRGHLETRYLDALPHRWMGTAVCVLAALTADPRTTREALEAIPPRAHPDLDGWRRAAGPAVDDPPLRETALALLDAARAGARRLPAGYLPADAEARIAAYRERFPASGRCPADELLERHRADPQDLGAWT